jgi:GNAT superfamily N-acetyltransferase
VTEGKLEIRRLEPADVHPMLTELMRAGFRKTAPLFDRYLREQTAVTRDVLVAWLDGKFAGYLTVLWNTSYGPFRQAGIPEINDFNVMPELRRRGIGTRLMDEAERLIAPRSVYSGIGVGMGADYGPAQRLYVLRGYVPDGRGLMDHEQPVRYGAQITVSHELAIYFTKKLR